MNENYLETAKALHLNNEQLERLAINGFEASWLSREKKNQHISNVKNYFASLKEGK